MGGRKSFTKKVPINLAQMKKNKKVFVSGCYDILHGGHIEFFRQAKSLGDYLIVCFASDAVYEKYKGRKSALPEKHKKYLLENVSVIDEVVMGENLDDPIFDFKDIFIKLKPDILVSTEDDRNADKKREFCKEHGAVYMQLKKELHFERISTTEIRMRISAPEEIPLRVDFAGGWLDVPKFSRPGAFVVNCTIEPKVSLKNWKYKIGSGLGGSAGYQFLSGKDCVVSELMSGVGWQDPAVIIETGLCVWRSGQKPILEAKINPDFLIGKMALLWNKEKNKTEDNTNVKRNYNKIEEASKIACSGVYKKSLKMICEAVDLSYKVQIKEGMMKLPKYNELAKKYCGGGHGGYALYIFKNQKEREKFLKVPNTVPIEP